jgi:hypothetical protein
VAGIGAVKSSIVAGHGVAVPLLGLPQHALVDEPSDHLLRLKVIASMLWPGTPPEVAPWHELDAGALLNLRARLSERYRFDVAGNYNSSLVAHRQHAGLVLVEEYQLRGL